MFSQDSITQKAQMEALDAEIDALIVQATPQTYRNAVMPEQSTLEAWWTGTLGKALPIPPETEIYWHDTRILRGSYGALYDYVLPLLTTEANATFIPQAIYWYDRTTLVFVGTNAGVAGTYLMNLDGNLTFKTANTILAVQTSLKKGLYISAGSVFLYDFVAGTSSNLSITTYASNPNVFFLMPSGDVYYLDTAASSKTIKLRTAGGSVSTIWDFTSLGAVTLQEIRYSATASKLILYMLSGGNIIAYSIELNGASPTLLNVPNTVGKRLNNYTPSVTNVQRIGGILNHSGQLIWNGGALTIATNTLTTATEPSVATRLTTVTNILEKAIKEAQTINNEAADRYNSKLSRYWGQKLFARIGTPLLMQRDPTNTATLMLTLRYDAQLTNGVYPSDAYVWSILPDNYSSGKVYPLSPYNDGRGDYFVAKRVVVNTTIKEINIDWSDVDMTDFGTLVITLDNGITAATENIQFQFNGDTGAFYDYSFWRIAVAAVSNVNATAATQILLYDVNSAATFGGKYMLTLIDCDEPTAETQIVIEGGTQIGITTGLVNCVLGVATWHKTARPTSLRIFLSGVTANFVLGATVEVAAYRTKQRYLRGDGFYGSDLG